MKNGLLYFVKKPLRGRVKTRLALNDEQRLGIYRAFIEDVSQQLAQVDADIWVCHAPAEAEDYFCTWLGEQFNYLAQEEGDLGTRLASACKTLQQRSYQKIAVIGSDIPEINAALIDDAFASLDNYDSCIGPCPDGGYYLLGINSHRYSPTIFSDIEWSSAAVLKQSVAAIETLGLSLQRLESRDDIDTLDDLRDYAQRNHTKNSKTMDYIRKECPGLLSTEGQKR